jgi:hypothetical protein
VLKALLAEEVCGRNRSALTTRRTRGVSRRQNLRRLNDPIQRDTTPNRDELGGLGKATRVNPDRPPVYDDPQRLQKPDPDHPDNTAVDHFPNSRMDDPPDEVQRLLIGYGVALDVAERLPALIPMASRPRRWRVFGPLRRFLRPTVGTRSW